MGGFEILGGTQLRQGLTQSLGHPEIDVDDEYEVLSVNICLLNTYYGPSCRGRGASDGKESACNAGDLDSIPALGRSPVEGNDHPFQYYI